MDDVDPLELELERQSEVVEVLRRVSDPALSDLESAKSDDIVSLGLLRDLQTEADSVRLEFVVPQDAATSGAVDRLRVKCEALLQAELPWVRAVQVDARVISDSAPTQLSPDGTLGAAGGEEVAPGVVAVKHIVAVASCKGGVGKSTTAVNLAYALHAAGAKVGLVDLDVCGPSLPTMVTPEAPLQRTEDEQLLPLTAHGVKLMSMGFLNPGMMVLRGVKITPVVQQLVGRTEWGELDYLVADMPPGTSDVQLTLAQDFSVSAAVLVTTPQRLSFVDVVKGVEMFDKVGIPTVAVVENMCSLQLDKLKAQAGAFAQRQGLSAEAAAELAQLVADLEAEEHLFGGSHTERLQQMWGIEASFALPLVAEIAAAADEGVPIVVSQPDSEAARIYGQLAAAVVREVSALEGAVVRPQLRYDATDGMVHITLPSGAPPQVTKRANEYVGGN